MNSADMEILENIINAMRDARDGLWSLSCEDAVKLDPKREKEKKDSLILDTTPEKAIVNGLLQYHPCIVATEEMGRRPVMPVFFDGIIFYIIDPLDGSKELCEIITKAKLETNAKTVKDACDYWNGERKDLYAEGSHASVTAIRDGAVIFNVMLNFATGNLFVASQDGAFSIHSDSYKSLDELALDGEKIKFRPGRDGFVTFCKKGKENRKSEYELNLENIGINSVPIGVSFQAGPARILYLSEKAEQPGGSAAFVLSNGEKLGEWAGWLAYAYTNPSLRFYKVFPAKQGSYSTLPLREGFLLAPTQPCTIFHGNRINMRKLELIDSPNLYRDTIVAVHEANIPQVEGMIKGSMMDITPTKTQG